MLEKFTNIKKERSLDSTKIFGYLFTVKSHQSLAQ